MAPSDSEKEPLSLNEALAAERPDTETPESQEPEQAAAPTVPAEPSWQAPDWTKRWKPEARDALGRFASHPELKTYLTPIQQQIEEMYGYTTKRDQEYADYKKRLDPLYQTLQPYEQRYQLAGIPLHQGVQQLMQAAELLQSNPDQAFPWLAGSHRPRDPQAAINQLAQAWGVDVASLMSEQPYVDPTVSALLTPLQQEVQEMRQMLAQQQQAGVQQQQSALVKEISDFEAAKDENGQPLHPHFATVFDSMVQLVQLGHAKDVNSAYALAVQLNPDLQKQAAEQAAEQARKKAMEEAAARTAAAEKSESASRNVQGKSRASGNQRLSLSLREAFDKAEQSLGSGG